MVSGAHTTKTPTPSMEKDARHARIHQAMDLISNVLRETSKAQIDSDHTLEVVYDQTDRWPQIELHLKNKEQDTPTPCILDVSAHDIMATGTINISLRSGEIFGEVHLSDADEFRKIPTLLKEAIRSFQKSISAHLLQVEQEHQRQQRAFDAARAEDLSDTDLFQEDDSYENVLHQEDSYGEEPIPLEF